MISSKTKVIKVVGALITDNQKVLLAKRARGNLIGEWEFPGGKIEPGETAFQAIEREIKEELNINVRAKELIHEFQHEYDFGLVQLQLIRCEVDIKDNNLTLDGSHSEIIYIDLKPKPQLLFAPLDRKIIEYLTT